MTVRSEVCGRTEARTRLSHVKWAKRIVEAAEAAVIG